jgi:hypothetical protein
MMNPSGVVLAALAAMFGCKDTTSGPAATNAIARLSAFKEQMCACRDTACAKQVSAEMAVWGRDQATDKPAALGAEEQTKASELGTQLGECMMRATAGASEAAGSGGQIASGSAPPPLAPVKNTLGLPAECDDYKAAIDRLAACESLSAAARETFVKGYQESAARWASMPESSRATLSTACQGGVDAVRAVAKARCGW